MSKAYESKHEDTKPEQPKDEPPQPEAEKFSPHECALHFGLVGTLRVPLGQTYYTDQRHPMARTFHGWSRYEYHEGGPFMLTLADYKAALKSAEKSPYQPHEPAMTKYAAAEYRQAAK